VSWRLAESEGLPVIEYDIIRSLGIRHGLVIRHHGQDIDEGFVYAALGSGKRLAVTEQTHSDRAAVVDGGFTDLYPRRAGVDGLMTDQRGTVITIHTADCVPILVASRTAVALAHAGWRGTARGIARKTVRDFIERYELAPSDVRAVVGPCIEQACYPVGAEVADRFAGGVKKEQADGTWLLDLRMANHGQLLQAGLKAEQIHVSSHCTRCDEAMFHSYRREGKLRGTMIAFMEVGDAHD
jgi:polyphenol oxidase